MGACLVVQDECIDAKTQMGGGILCGGGVRRKIYFVYGDSQVVVEGDGAAFGAGGKAKCHSAGGGVGEEGERPLDVGNGAWRHGKGGVGPRGAIGLRPQGKGEAEVVDAGAVVVLAAGIVLLVNPF